MKKNHRFHPVLTLLIGLLILVGLWALTQLMAHGNKRKESHAHQLTVMTYNTHRLGGFKKADQNEVLQYIRQKDVDVVCLQEVEVYKDPTYLMLPELKEALKQYPYTYFDFKVYNKKRQFGNAVFSKYPLINKKTIRYHSNSNISSQCDVVVGGDTLRLMVNHLESNKIKDVNMEELDSLSNQWMGAARRRYHQSNSVHKAIEEATYPVIVVGDFNDTPLSYTYQRIKRGLRDCFLECGGLGRVGNTFIRNHIGVRIDYVLCAKELVPLDAFVDRVEYSDHYPLHVTLGWD